eukprot:CAMPEP_0172493034 /NCGR_PEP_ID=MMETSP1066-20121228/24353_1 /TAXON_ID=671091 /ORGANISM="Coscinodiscus wailesii, Strain CCMP2513" /LENGTH=126 /DNA_ID=CAMNT_0013262975 /DNA_START=160 /DNA_END=537 /DNA_ORIENTATION=-
MKTPITLILLWMVSPIGLVKAGLPRTSSSLNHDNYSSSFTKANEFAPRYDNVDESQYSIALDSALRALGDDLRFITHDILLKELCNENVHDGSRSIESGDFEDFNNVIKASTLSLPDTNFTHKSEI